MVSVAAPAYGTIAAMVPVEDLADRTPIALADGEEISLGEHLVRWIDAPHMPHVWEYGFPSEENTKTLLCDDLFAQGSADNPAITESDILEPSEAFRLRMDYFSHTRNADALLDRLAATSLATQACMHESPWRGDGAKLLRELATTLSS